MKFFIHLFLLFVLLAPPDSSASNSDSTYYVINLRGAKIYAEPSFQSNILGNVSSGEVLIIKKTESEKLTQHIGKGFFLTGQFMKTINGYIFSTDLSPIKPEMSEIVKTPLLLGSEILKKTVTGTKYFGNSPFTVKDIITEFTHATYTYTDIDSCFDRVFTTKNLQFHEVYHLFVSLFADIDSNGQISHPQFLKKEGNTCFFDDFAAATKIVIIDHSDGTYTIASNDCT